ncbi:hypothetical protein ACLOJK_001279 [Asimina triloba]
MVVESNHLRGWREVRKQCLVVRRGSFLAAGIFDLSTVFLSTGFYFVVLRMQRVRDGEAAIQREVMEAALFSTPETTLSNTLSSAPISAVDLEVVEEPSAGDRSVDFVKKIGLVALFLLLPKPSYLSYKPGKRVLTGLALRAVSPNASNTVFCSLTLPLLLSILPLRSLSISRQRNLHKLCSSIVRKHYCSLSHCVRSLPIIFLLRSHKAAVHPLYNNIISVALFLLLPKPSYLSYKPGKRVLTGLALRAVSPNASNTGQPEYCGDPKFKLNCTDDGSPTIYMLSERFDVESIDPERRTLTLVDEDLAGDTCSTPSANTTIDPTAFNFSDQDLNLTLYYECRVDVPLDYRYFFPLPCDPTVAGTYAFFTLFPHHNASFASCKVAAITLSKTVSSLLRTGTPLPADAVPSLFRVAVKTGFEVTWESLDISWCEGCTGSSGRCGYNPDDLQQRVCLCSDQPHQDTCQGPRIKLDRGMRKMDHKQVGAFSSARLCFVN